MSDTKKKTVGRKPQPNPSAKKIAKEVVKQEIGIADKMLKNLAAGKSGTVGKKAKPATRSSRKGKLSSVAKRNRAAFRDEREDFTYGPASSDYKQNLNVDATISVEMDIDVNRTFYLAGVVVACGLTYGNPVLPDTLYPHYVYRFLAEYMINHWCGIVNLYNPQKLPAVLLDLLHAGEEKLAQNLTARVKTIGTITAVVPSIANNLSGFGTLTALAGSSRYQLGNSFSGYTVKDGFEHTKTFLSICGTALDLQDAKTYRKIRTDDFSFYSMIPEKDTTGAKNWDIFVHNDVRFHYAGSVYCIKKPMAHWIARVTPIKPATTASPIYARSPAFMNRSAPASVIAHRIREKLRGYDAHDEEVILKPVNASELLATYLAEIASFGASNSYFPTDAAYANMSFEDVKTGVLFHILKWARPWIATSYGVASDFYGGKSTETQRGVFLRCGSGDVPDRAWDTMPFSGALNFNLGCLSPFKRGNVWYYPCPFVDIDLDYLDVPNITYGTAVITSTYKWQTGVTTYSATNYECGAYQLTSASFMNTWGKLNQIMGRGSKVTVGIPRTRFNAASLTYITDGATDYHYTLLVASPKRLIYSQILTPELREILGRLVIPYSPTIQEGGLIDDWMGQWQVVFQEPRHEIMKTPDTVLQLAVNIGSLNAWKVIEGGVRPLGLDDDHGLVSVGRRSGEIGHGSNSYGRFAYHKAMDIAKAHEKEIKMAGKVGALQVGLAAAMAWANRNENDRPNGFDFQDLEIGAGG